MARLRWSSTRHAHGREGHANFLRRLSMRRRAGAAGPGGRLGPVAEEGAENAAAEPKASGRAAGAVDGELEAQREEAADGDDDDADDDDDESEKGAPRRIFVNCPLDADMLDEGGQPSMEYARNKIQTSKYTPLTFLPKNLFYQFHNVANIYFLVLVILQCFQIFGAVSPGLSAVPLIAIVVITGIKDAIEDTRRTILDNEVNNEKVYTLHNWHNVNIASERVSLWRRFKKAITHGLQRWYYKARGRESEIHDLQRMTTFRMSQDQPRASLGSNRMSLDHMPRRSLESARAGGALGVFDSPRASFDGVKRPSFDGARPRPSFDAMTRSGSAESMSYLAGKLRLKKTPSRFTGTLDDGDDDDMDGHAAASMPSVIDRYKQVPGKARFKTAFWKNVRVGDIIRIGADEAIPADVAVLSTSESDGVCYVETKNLDGETNLKLRNSLQCGRMIKRETDCEAATFMIESEPPSADLYHYTGVIKWTVRDPNTPEIDGKLEAEPIDINNVLLRGCSLRNTKWAIGVVIYTGPDTKIMMNSGMTPTKRSKISRELNWTVVTNFLVLFSMCIVAGIVAGIKSRNHASSYYFFDDGIPGNTSAAYGVISFVVAIILFQNLVPISLYISIEIVKTAQAFFIYSDHWMYYDKINYPCTPKSWNISDDLGQIEYIFSDKTGTLTQNVMEFRKCTIGGKAYGEAYTEAQVGMDKRRNIDVEAHSKRMREHIENDKARMIEAMSTGGYMNIDPDKLAFVSSQLVADQSGASGAEQKAAIDAYMMALSVCHTVVTEKKDDGTLEYKAQSPDEAALVQFSRDLGYALVTRTQRDLFLSIMGRRERFQVLDVIEFNSDRKRMSVIARVRGKIMLYCKGADNVIIPLLASAQDSLLQQTTAQLEEFSAEGLRTLCVCSRELSELEYSAWKERLKIVSSEIEDRDAKIMQVSAEIEKDLCLLGGTAIEDQLQEGVPDAIATLGEAGIKLWVLTGDKVETAINIGYSCNLLRNDLHMMLLTDLKDMDAADKQVTELLMTEFGLTGSDEDLAAARKDHSPPPPTHALVIDGVSLHLMLQPEMKQKFLILCKNCRSVLCCRVSPSQKAAVTDMVKRGLGVMTLSVGDGANDVAMIQAADVGVGIAGEEGRQAVMSADYAIGQFRFLLRLILVHGRWDYRRLSEMIACFFYKNVVWTFILFWYSIFTNFDGYYVFDYTYILLVNLAFTSLPVIFMGVFDQDLSDKVSLKVPSVYTRGILGLDWNNFKFWSYMFDGLYQSAVCFFLPYCLWHNARKVSQNGLDANGISGMGVFIATPAILVMNTFVLLNQSNWDVACIGIWWFSILIFFFWTGVYSQFQSSIGFYDVSPRSFGLCSYWALMFVVIAAALLPRFCYNTIQKFYFPSEVDLVREQVAVGKFDYLKQENNDSEKEGAENGGAGGAGSAEGSTVPTAASKNGIPSSKKEMDSSSNESPDLRRFSDELPINRSRSGTIDLDPSSINYMQKRASRQTNFTNETYPSQLDLDLSHRFESSKQQDTRIVDTDVVSSRPISTADMPGGMSDALDSDQDDPFRG